MKVVCELNGAREDIFKSRVNTRDSLQTILIEKFECKNRWPLSAPMYKSAQKAKEHKRPCTGRERPAGKASTRKMTTHSCAQCPVYKKTERTRTEGR